MSSSQISLDGQAGIGVISDTHGLLRPSALTALRGSDFIIHAGDVGRPGVLEGLRTIAPVIAVRGNVDYGGWADALPMSAVLSLGGHDLHILHILADIGRDPKASGFAAVIYGHSHKPDITETDGVVYFNPGSAGPRRFKLPVTVGRLSIKDGRVTPELLPIEA